jgi:hypothetical protein
MYFFYFTFSSTLFLSIFLLSQITICFYFVSFTTADLYFVLLITAVTNEIDQSINLFLEKFYVFCNIILIHLYLHPFPYIFVSFSISVISSFKHLLLLRFHELFSCVYFIFCTTCFPIFFHSSPDFSLFRFSYSPSLLSVVTLLSYRHFFRGLRGEFLLFSYLGILKSVKLAKWNLYRVSQNSRIPNSERCRGSLQ